MGSFLSTEDSGDCPRDRRSNEILPSALDVLLGVGGAEGERPVLPRPHVPVSPL